MIHESSFQSKLIKEIKKQYPGSVILKNDPNYIQGIPDWLILFEDRWAVLEAKADETSRHQPNQDYYVDILNKMSYSSFVYPSNREQVLHELQFALRGYRPTRIPRRI